MINLNLLTTRLLVPLILFWGSNPGSSLYAETVETGKQVSFHYSVSLPDGQLLTSTFNSRPLEYIHGTRQLIPGLEAALAGMQPAEQKNFEVPAASAYGNIDPQKIITVDRTTLAADIQPGQFLQGLRNRGQPVTARVVEIRPESVVLDFNHPLAGKNLVYHVRILTVQNSAASQQ